MSDPSEAFQTLALVVLGIGVAEHSHIVGLDQHVDSGSRVASTRQVGRIEVVKIESKGKGFRACTFASRTSWPSWPS